MEAVGIFIRIIRRIGFSLFYMMAVSYTHLWSHLFFDFCNRGFIYTFNCNGIFPGYAVPVGSFYHALDVCDPDHLSCIFIRRNLSAHIPENQPHVLLYVLFQDDHHRRGFSGADTVYYVSGVCFSSAACRRPDFPKGPGSVCPAHLKR